MRVGLYGGTFNPPHAGHLHVADEARRRLGLDRVVFLVTQANPLKDTRGLEGAEARRAALAHRIRRPWAVFSDIEGRIGSRYSIDTVRWLKARYPGVRFVFVMGADSLAGLHRWKAWPELARAVPIAIVSRPGYGLRGRLSPFARLFRHARLPARSARTLVDRSPPAWVYLPAPFKDISSTALRQAVLKM
jgi:nicotinate-nucleotide adenylyltransferase